MLEKYNINENKILYPPYHNGKYLEQYFIDFYFKHKKEFDDTGYLFLPICWTDIYNHRKDLKLTLQQDLNKLDKSQKYFIVCQHADAPAEVLPFKTIKFAAGGSRKNCIPIPLVCSAIPPIECVKKDIFCSFVGSVATHKIREQLVKILNPLENYVIHTKECWSSKLTNNEKDLFLDITSRSKFCLAPRGTGPTSFRLYEAMQLEAVPVYIYSIVPYLPFKDCIDWESICVLIEEQNVFNIDSILKNISTEKHEFMKKNIKRIYKDFFTLEAVCRKILDYLKGDPDVMEKNTLRWKHYNK